MSGTRKYSYRLKMPTSGRGLMSQPAVCVCVCVCVCVRARAQTKVGLCAPVHRRPVENSLSAPCQGAWPCEAGLQRNVRGRRDQESQRLNRARESRRRRRRRGRRRGRRGGSPKVLASFEIITDSICHSHQSLMRKKCG